VFVLKAEFTNYANGKLVYKRVVTVSRNDMVCFGESVCTVYRTQSHLQLPSTAVASRIIVIVKCKKTCIGGRRGRPMSSLSMDVRNGCSVRSMNGSSLSH